MSPPELTLTTYLKYSTSVFFKKVQQKSWIKIMNPLIFHQNSSHGPSMFNHCSGCKRSKRSVDYQRSGSRRFLLPLFLLEHQSFHEVLVFLCLSLSHHHKQGCLPSWQWMESLWNWRRGGWPLALYGEDKTPSGRPTLHKTSSIISFAQATDWPASAMLSSQTPQEKVQKKGDTLTGLIFCTLLHVQHLPARLTTLLT